MMDGSSFRRRRWVLAEPDAQAAALAARLKTSPLIAQVLLNRGLADPDACHAFLRPSLKCLHDPAGLPGVAHAAERIARAIRAGEKIVIYGDYDVDGITATALLWHAIRLFGGQVDYYIPHRIDEGYGLNSQAIGEICDNGAGLIVTVDCGVTALEPACVAKERGVDLIVTDHHLWHGANERLGDRQTGDTAPSLDTPRSSHDSPRFPDCAALVHPRLPHDPPYPNPHLCGAGVAFKLAWGVGLAMSGGSRVSEEFKRFLVEATGLAALGTIADVVPLTGENRILAAFGLGGLKQSRLVGIQALIESAGLTGKKLDSYHVGFLLAPRLNACGRMGHARLAVEMLTTADAARATEIAIYLEQQNRERQAIERQILDEAIEQIRELRLDGDDCRAIVLAKEGWHPGVIGIVASRIVDRFHRPTILIAINNGVGQGSGRSISGFHLANALEVCGSHLVAFGGHEMAAGLKIASENVEAFREAFCRHAGEVLAPEQLVPVLKLDVRAELHQVTATLVNDLKRLGPFGHGNRKPVLLCRDLELTAPPRRVGRTGDHLQLHVRQGQLHMKCIAFNTGALYNQLTPGTTLHLAVEPVLNEFNGTARLELDVKDLQFQEAARGQGSAVSQNVSAPSLPEP